MTETGEEIFRYNKNKDRYKEGYTSNFRVKISKCVLPIVFIVDSNPSLSRFLARFEYYVGFAEIRKCMYRLKA